MNRAISVLIVLLFGVAIGVFIDRSIINQTAIQTSLNSESLIDAKFDIVRVYGADEDYNNVDVNFLIEIDIESTILGKLNEIAHHLSRYKFSFLPIQIVSIDSLEGKSIAVIDLKEQSWNKGFDSQNHRGNAGVMWKMDYFQGTTGGRFTSQTLIQTFLQNDYHGEWIDGVKFLYEGAPIQNWDHIQLSHTIFRETE